ncbi:MAG: hypothetical protein EPO65_11940 [Dehalococcoidia bacterium]|nr:MAG: hypothetical protein EPO65_11940 [Dehalococcoidia bacterium]
MAREGRGRHSLRVPDPATAGFDGKRINYGCTDKTSILGDLVPGTPWTARFVTGSVGPNGFTPATDEVKPLATVYQ